MNRRIGKWIRVGLFAVVPLAGRAVLAQASDTPSGIKGTTGASGGQPAGGLPDVNQPPPVTDDTRTPAQQRAGKLEESPPSMPSEPSSPQKPSGAGETNPPMDQNTPQPNAPKMDQNAPQPNAPKMDQNTPQRPSSGPGNLERQDIDRKPSTDFKNNTAAPKGEPDVDK
jgi:hypothetical protein